MRLVFAVQAVAFGAALAAEIDHFSLLELYHILTVRGWTVHHVRVNFQEISVLLFIKLLDLILVSQRLFDVDLVHFNLTLWAAYWKSLFNYLRPRMALNTLSAIQMQTVFHEHDFIAFNKHVFHAYFACEIFLVNLFNFPFLYVIFILLLLSTYLDCLLLAIFFLYIISSPFIFTRINDRRLLRLLMLFFITFKHSSSISWRPLNLIFFHRIFRSIPICILVGLHKLLSSFTVDNF